MTWNMKKEYFSESLLCLHKQLSYTQTHSRRREMWRQHSSFSHFTDTLPQLLMHTRKNFSFPYSIYPFQTPPLEFSQHVLTQKFAFCATWLDYIEIRGKIAKADRVYLSIAANRNIWLQVQRGWRSPAVKNEIKFNENSIKKISLLRCTSNKKLW